MNHIWDKPLDPFLGETYQSVMEDGSKIYMEQVCQHPPISYMLQVGPNEAYRLWGWSSLSPKVQMNSIDVEVKGVKNIEFADGTLIEYQPHQDAILNTVWGNLVHLICGRVDFVDKKNGLTAWYEINSVARKPKDYFQGEIIMDGQVVSKLYGNQMGYIDFDGVRYWDVRDQVQFLQQGEDLSKKTTLMSDSRRRLDAINRLAGEMDIA